MKPNFDKVIKCKLCKGSFRKKFYFTPSTKFRWKLFYQAMGIALALEIIANIAVFLIFR